MNYKQAADGATRMTPHVAWIISGDREKASSRLQGFLIHEWLVDQGVRSEIIATDFNRIDSAASADFFSIAIKMRCSMATHAVFEAPEWSMVQLAKLWRSWGRSAIAVRCDNLSGAYDDNFDLTIVPTEGLRAALQINRARIISDMVEVPSSIYKQDYRAGKKIKVVWVGHPSYENYITQLVSRLRSHPEIEESFQFELISKGSFATRQWSRETVVADTLEGDVALLPIPQGEWYHHKSSNRLAMMFSLGMPVVASRIPSYEELGRDGANVFFFDSEDEIMSRLMAFRSNETRQRIGKQGRISLGDRYGIAKIGPQWAAAIESATHVACPNENWRMWLFGLAIGGIALPWRSAARARSALDVLGARVCGGGIGRRQS